MEAAVRPDIPAELRRLYPALLALARARSANEADAQDAAQETAMRALRTQDGYRPEAPVERWIFTIEANVLRDMARRARTRRERAPEAAEPPVLDPAGAIEKAEDVGRIAQAIRRLDASESAPLLLHLVHGLPQAEVAGLLEISVEHLRVRLYRTIRKIRRALGIKE